MRVLLVLLSLLLAFWFGDQLRKVLDENNSRQIQNQSTQTVCTMVMPETLTAKGKAICNQ
jgi:hypothetical protein